MVSWSMKFSFFCKRTQYRALLEPSAGYGTHRRLHTSGAGDVAGLHLPVVIYFIEEEQKFELIRDRLLLMVTDGLVEAHTTTVLKSAISSERVLS